MNRLLGITHFYLYQHYITPNVSCVMKEYAEQGLVTLIDWTGGPYKSVDEIRSENMFAALNDCLYRGMYKHKYLILFDLDEYLIPKKHNDLIDLTKDEEKKEANLATLLFQNAFFYLQWPDDPGAKKSQLITVAKTRRVIDLDLPGVRSKYICKPEEVVEAGNHYLWEARTSQMKQVPINPDTGLSHHYRIKCEAERLNCLNVNTTVDKSTWKWKIPLQKALSQQSVGKKCELTPFTN
jgi:Glycosyltransferase family 92